MNYPLRSEDTAENLSTLFPDLQTDRLLLRQLNLDDTDFIFRHFSDPKITEYLLDEPPLANIEEARAIITFFQNPERNTYHRWGIIRKTDHRIIGTCGFHKWEKAHFRAEIGYDLASDCWGQGFMTEALMAVIKNGFERMALHRIDALVYVRESSLYPTSAETRI